MIDVIVIICDLRIANIYIIIYYLVILLVVNLVKQVVTRWYFYKIGICKKYIT